VAESPYGRKRPPVDAVEEVEMLGDNDVMATIAVADIDIASAFYEGTLGLKRVETDDPNPEAIVYRSGNSRVLVYRSQYAGTNQATAASWGIGGDFDAVVEELRSKGVSFEHYDMPGLTREGDVHVMGDMKAAWFKDPDGNIVNISNQPIS
jgi:catechol 2,3-dioxygenase-like lactoylglutathione lyase family enzyme